MTPENKGRTVTKSKILTYYWKTLGKYKISRMTKLKNTIKRVKNNRVHQ